MVNQVTNDTFQKEVMDAKGVVVVDFYADWCGPCKMVSPILDEMSKDINDVKFVKVNVDENGETAAKYNVASIPTFLFVKDGKVVSQTIGAQAREVFEAEIEKVKAMN